MLTEMVARTAAPIVFVVLARLLTPEDYGVVGTAMIGIAFCQMFWDAGLGKALIQIRDSPAEAAQVVFWTNLALGAIIYALLFASAASIAEFFKCPAAKAVLRVLGLQVVIGSLTSVQQALFVRELNFRKLFWIKACTAFVPGLISIPMAFCGYGVWALVAGTLAGQTANMVLLWTQSPWKPRRQYNVVLARKLFGFGAWIILESFGAWLISWGDSVIVGRYLGVHDLGVYRTGLMMVTIVFGLLINPIVPIMYTTFSRLQDDLVGLSSAFHRVNRMIVAFALPIGTGLLLVGPEVTAAVFGDRWHGLGLVIGVLGLQNGLGWLVGLNAELYRAMGRPEVNTKFMFGQLFLYLPAFYVAVQEGLGAFVFTKLGLCIIAVPVHICLCVQMLRVSPLYLWHEGKAMILASVGMGVVVLLVKSALHAHLPHSPAWLVLVLLVSTGVATYLAAVCRMDPQFVAGLRVTLGGQAKTR